MQTPTNQLVSLSEVALICFALMLLAATPAKTMLQETTEQQPVNLTVPAEQSTDVVLKSA